MHHDESEGLTALEALGIAIRAEMDTREVYEEMVRRAEDPQIRRRFELLAAEEKQHCEYLEVRWNELAPGVPLKLPESRLQLAGGQPAGRSLENVLDMALAQERHSREFYLRAARETGDLSGRAMFRFLADMAYQHWLALAQEKDMLVRYPNYGRPGKMPWHPEDGLASRGAKEGS